MIKNKKVYFITTAEGPGEAFEEDMKRVVEPVIGWVNCFEGMEFVKTLVCYDTGHMDVRDSQAYAEAHSLGALI